LLEEEPTPVFGFWIRVFDGKTHAPFSILGLPSGGTDTANFLSVKLDFNALTGMTDSSQSGCLWFSFESNLHANTISHTGGLSTDFCLNLAKISIILAGGLFDGFRVNPLLLRYFSSGDMMPSSSLDRSWLHL
jgi:hypothetical protein